MTECASGFKFACIFVQELFKQTAARLLSVLDVLVLVSWSPFTQLPGQEPAYPLADLLCYLRLLSVNVAVSFRNSTGIWPDVLLVVTHLLSAVILSDAFLSKPLYYLTLAFVAAEFVIVFFSTERRRQRNLWRHNATFRISQLTRNPFQRSMRRSLLLPLINRRPNSHDESEDVNVVKIHDRISSTFVDITPQVSGHRPEKRVLHVHCLHSSDRRAKATVVFLHQFGSGAFTWQAVIAELADTNKLNLLAFDRQAHGLTFASEPLLESRDASLHTTPVGEEEIPTVHFSDAVNAPEFDTELVDSLIEHLTFVNGPIFLIASGGAGARIAMDYVSRSVRAAAVKGLVFVSPYDLASDGVPSVLKSVSSAQVGRALVVSMAKSEVADVLLRRSWESKPIPASVAEAYKNSVSTPGWEDAMLNFLRRPVTPEPSLPNLSVPTLVLAGECDHFIESIDEYRQFASRFPHSNFELIPKVGASPQEERPKEVSRLIRAFIARSLDS